MDDTHAIFLLLSSTSNSTTDLYTPSYPLSPPTPMRTLSFALCVAAACSFGATMACTPSRIARLGVQSLPVRATEERKKWGMEHLVASTGWKVTFLSLAGRIYCTTLLSPPFATYALLDCLELLRGELARTVFIRLMSWSGGWARG